MATAANRAVIQTALLSVKSLRRRRLGHISPASFPQNGKNKWGRKENGLPNNLLAMGGAGRRPAPRASLVLGGEKPRRRNGLNGGTNGLNGTNGIHGSTANPNNNAKSLVNGSGGADMNGKRLVSNRMDQQRSTIRRYVNGSSPKNGLAAIHDAPQLNGSACSTLSASNKENENTQIGNKYSSDLVVVLDMDECLIHSQFLSDQLVDKYRQVEDRPTRSTRQGGEEAESLFLNACDSFRINLPDGDLVNVNKRPNLDIFLREITSKFETYIFTAAMEVSSVVCLCFAEHLQSDT